MAPHFFQAEYDRAHYHRGLDSAIDAASISDKIHFFHYMGLSQSTPRLLRNVHCMLCYQYKCICHKSNSMVDVTMNLQFHVPKINLKLCSVQINGVVCKFCEKLLKCGTDIPYHMQIHHRHRLKVTLKFGKDIICSKWIKRRYLKRHKQYNISRTTVDGREEKYVESAVERNPLEMKSNEICDADATQSRGSLDFQFLPDSGPSLGSTNNGSLWQFINCYCCGRNNSRRHYNDHDNNRDNHTCPNTYITHIANKKTVELNSISGQTSDWLENSTTPISSITKETEQLNNDLSEISIESPYYDLTYDANYESNELDEIPESKEKQLLLGIPKCDLSDTQGVRISDAIRDLMIAETSLSSHDHEESSMRAPTIDFCQDANDEESFALGFDDSEESCNFVIKEGVTACNEKYSTRCVNDLGKDRHLETAVDHHDELDESSKFWKTPIRNLECYSTMELPVDSVYNRHSSISIKRELILDHYLFDGE